MNKSRRDRLHPSGVRIQCIPTERGANVVDGAQHQRGGRRGTGGCRVVLQFASPQKSAIRRSDRSCVVARNYLAVAWKMDGLNVEKQGIIIPRDGMRWMMRPDQISRAF